MKVSKAWLKELVEVKDMDEVIRLLPLRTIAIRSITDDFIELDMKGYNRADLLSMRGVAREVAAITDSKIKFDADLPAPDYSLPIKIAQVEDYKLCPVYCLAKVEGLKTDPSKPEIIKKLNESGIRSINDIADLTNLIMLEFGQPMHAFDADKVKGIVSVRLAKKGEKLLTLDGKTRDLDPEDLVIADEGGPIGLAGVMGGKETEVTDSTKTILLEAAIFDPISIRKTAQRHHLPSEASKRFQHGLSKLNLLQALTQALWIYEKMEGRIAALLLLDVKEFFDEEKVINLTQAKVNGLIGIDISATQVEEYLQKLGFQLKGVDGGWEVTVPYWRLDIEIEVDLVEEVARMYGYEKIPAKPLEGGTPEKIDESLPNLIYDLKKKLSDIGLTEVQTYSFYSTAVLNALGFTEEGKKTMVRVANPMSAETEYLRTDIWPNIVEALGRNLRNGYSDIAIFEVGKSYHKSYDGKENPEEGFALSIALMNGSDNPMEELVTITKELGMDTKLGSLPAPEIVKALFHPNRLIRIEKDGKEIGGAAEVHLKVLHKLGIEKRVAILEINLPF